MPYTRNVVEMEVRFKLVCTDDDVPASTIRRCFMKALRGFHDQGVMFTCTENDHEIHIVKATRLQRQSQDS